MTIRETLNFSAWFQGVGNRGGKVIILMKNDFNTRKQVILTSIRFISEKKL